MKEEVGEVKFRLLSIWDSLWTVDPLPGTISQVASPLQAPKTRGESERQTQVRSLVWPLKTVCPSATLLSFSFLDGKTGTKVCFSVRAFEE